MTSEEPRAIKALPLFEIFLAALSGLLLEIAYTRVYSFKVFYYFTYLILGLGLLGMTVGGVLVAFSGRLRAIAPHELVVRSAYAGAASISVGYFVIAPLPLNLSGRGLTSILELVKLVVASTTLIVPFVAVGLIVAALLSAHAERAGRLYAFDLLGASTACALAIPILEALDPPGTIALSACLLALCGLVAGRSSRRLITAGIALLSLLAVPVALRSRLPDPIAAADKRYEDFREAGSVIFSRWSPVFRIDVSRSPIAPDTTLLVQHDGLPGSGLWRFDGDLSRWASLETDVRSLPFTLVPPRPKVLVIGAAGGHELVAALYFGAGHVTGVELNPVTYSLVTDVFADFTGHLNEHPQITYVLGDGRSFLERAEERYDLIWFVTPDSYAAMNAASSGSFVLSESYLYTAEAVQVSLDHLTPQGVICTAFGELDYARRPNSTTRYLLTAREAFEAAYPNARFSDHVLVSNTPGFLPPFTESTMFIGRSMFTASAVQRFHERLARIPGARAPYAPGRQFDGSPTNQALALHGSALESFVNDYPYQIGPVRDDAPFFWHFTRFSDALVALVLSRSEGGASNLMIGEQVSLVFLGLVAVLGGLLLGLPIAFRRGIWVDVPHKRLTFAYFASVGLGFMFLEVALIQKLTLILGYPTYSLSVTLFSLLASSGIGSWLSTRHEAQPVKRLVSVISMLGVVLVSYQLGLDALYPRLVTQSLWLRILACVVLVAPIGLLLGAFMPLGLRRIAESSAHWQRYAAWAWAVNGLFSVIASILATVIAMSAGFNALLLMALATYGLGVAALSRMPHTVRTPR